MSRFIVPTPTADGMVVVLNTHHGALATVNCGQLKDKGANAVLNHLYQLAMHSGGRLIVSFKNVREISIGTLRGILDLHQRCHGLGGRLVLCDMPKDASKVMHSIAESAPPHIARSPRDAVAVLSGTKRPGLFKRAA